MNKELLLYYMCDEKYDYFIPLFCYFASLSNPEAKIEIHTPDIEQFQFLTELYDVKFHSIEKGLKSVNMLRFLTEPELKLPYTYIGDIDVLLLDNILLAQRDTVNNQIPVNNIVRPGDKKRMSGLQFVKTDPYFKDVRKLQKVLKEKFYPNYNDEKVLYKLVDEIYGVDILTKLNPQQLRPVFGIHCSPNRKILRTVPNIPGWEVEGGQAERAVKLMARNEFKEIENILKSKAKKIVGELREYVKYKGNYKEFK